MQCFVSESVITGELLHTLGPYFLNKQATPQLPNPGIGLLGFAVAWIISLQE